MLGYILHVGYNSEVHVSWCNLEHLIVFSGATPMSDTIDRYIYHRVISDI
jgi:hypothetical protein